MIYLSGLAEWYYRDNKKENLVMDRQEYENQIINVIDLIKNNTGLDPYLIENNIVKNRPHIKAICTYLSQYQLLPYKRTSELFYDLFGTRLAASAIVSANCDFPPTMYHF